MYLTNKEFITAVRDTNTLNLREYIRSHNRLRRDARLSDRHILNYYKAVRGAVLNRVGEFPSYIRDEYAVEGFRPYQAGVWKWLRPWEHSDKLKAFTVPEGDFGVGLEVEMGFTRTAHAVEAVAFIKNWQHVTADFEGGPVPVEATFPPELYSKFGTRSRGIRYVRNLAAMGDKVVSHREYRSVGIHVNVSNSSNTVNGQRLNEVNYALGGLTEGQKLKYFGRRLPYSYGYSRSTSHAQWIEWKLFNSTTNWKQLHMYVNVGVALAALVADNTRDTSPVEVLSTLEKAYNKNRL